MNISTLAIIWTLAAAAVAVVILAVVLTIIIINAVARKNGKFVRRKTERKLKSFAGIRRYALLSDITLPYKDTTVTIDNLMIGIFGILVVDSYDFRGELYGSADQQKWTYIDKKTGARTSMESLVTQSQAKAEAVRLALTAQGIYKVNIDYINVVQDSPKKLVLYVPESLPVMRISKLSKYLGKSKFNTELGVDIEKLKAAISSKNLPKA